MANMTKLTRTSTGYHASALGESFHVTNAGQWHRAVEGTSRHWQAKGDKGTELYARSLSAMRQALADLSATTSLGAA